MFPLTRKANPPNIFLSRDRAFVLENFAESISKDFVVGHNRFLSTDRRCGAVVLFTGWFQAIAQPAQTSIGLYKLTMEYQESSS